MISLSKMSIPVDLFSHFQLDRLDNLDGLDDLDNLVDLDDHDNLDNEKMHCRWSPQPASPSPCSPPYTTHLPPLPYFLSRFCFVCSQKNLMLIY